jgi:hypothetical protein
MKKPILLPLLFIVTALIIGAGGFWVGRYREHRIANSLIAGTFINNFDALEKLRAGDTESTTRSLERHAFLHATFLLNDSAPQQQQVIGMFRSRLVAYRQTYRANSAEWTPMERKLQELLRTSK